MPGWDVIAVGVIVGAALLWAVRGVWRATRSKRICSDCASSGRCPIMAGGDESAPGSTCEVTELETRVGAPDEDPPNRLSDYDLIIRSKK